MTTIADWMTRAVVIDVSIAELSPMRTIVSYPLSWSSYFKAGNWIDGWFHGAMRKIQNRNVTPGKRLRSGKGSLAIVVEWVLGSKIKDIA